MLAVQTNHVITMFGQGQGCVDNFVQMGGAVPAFWASNACKAMQASCHHHVCKVFAVAEGCADHFVRAIQLDPRDPSNASRF